MYLYMQCHSSHCRHAPPEHARWRLDELSRRIGRLELGFWSASRETKEAQLGVQQGVCNLEGCKGWAPLLCHIWPQRTSQNNSAEHNAVVGLGFILLASLFTQHVTV